MASTGADSEKLCWQLAASIPHALWIGDASSKVISYVNPAWERLTGRRVVVGDGLGRIYESVHPDDLERVLAAIRLVPNENADLEYRILRPDAAVRWVHARTFSIVVSKGRAPRIAGIIEDITKRVDESLRVERLKHEFVSTVSHELRTPMTSVAASLGLLLEGAAGKLPESATRLLAIARSNSQRLIRLINDILDIETLESERAVFNLKTIEVLSLVEQTVDANRGFAESHGARIRIADPTFIGAIRADPDRLAQVLTNLLSNAIKFTPEGGEVSVHMEERGDLVHIAVRDHGTGVPAEFRSRIFEKFAQADVSDSRPPNGTGLGLSIVKQIVTRLGGQVGFEDAPGGGAIFYVDFPIWTDPPGAADSPAAAGETENALLRRAVSDLTVDKLMLQDAAASSDAAGGVENSRLRRAVSDLTVDKLILEQAAREKP